MKKHILLLAGASMAALALTSHAQAAENDWNYYWNKNEAATNPLLAAQTTPSEKTPLGRSVYFSIEGAHSFADRKQKADLDGFLFSLNFYSNYNESRTHQFFVQCGVLNGNKTNHEALGMFEKNGYSNVPLNVGYNYNYALTERLLMYVGAKAGLTFTERKITTDLGTNRCSDTAPTAGVGAGLKFALTPRVDALFGYEFYRDFSSFSGKSDFNSYHMLHAGFSFGF